MGGRIEASGASLEEALGAAVAAWTGRGDVRIRIEGADLTTTGPVTVTIEAAEVPASGGAVAEATAEQGAEPAPATEGDVAAAGAPAEAQPAESSVEAVAESAAASAAVAAAPAGTEPAVDVAEGGAEEAGEVDLDAEADAAADIIEGVLDALDLPGDIRIRVHEDRAEVEVVEVGSGALIGRRGQTLEALQDLVRAALQKRFGRRCRVMIDVEGYRARRIARLLEKADRAIEQVRRTGEPVRLEPMDAFERRAVHRRVAEYPDLRSRSVGREPNRRIIIEPAGADEEE